MHALIPLLILQAPSLLSTSEAPRPHDAAAPLPAQANVLDEALSSDPAGQASLEAHRLLDASEAPSSPSIFLAEINLHDLLCIPTVVDDEVWSQTTLRGGALAGTSVPEQLREGPEAALPVIRHYAWDGQYLHDEGVLRAGAQIIQRPFMPGEREIVLLTPDLD